MNTPQHQSGDSSSVDNGAVKRLFLAMLDAEESDGSDAAGSKRAALDALDGAATDVRDAAIALMEAHHRAKGLLLDDSTAPTRSALPPPTFDNYRVLREIGRGGFGVVYEAEQTHPVQRHVALKVLRADVASDATAARFRTEAAALARLQHPAIAGVFDAGFDATGRAFLAVELIDGAPVTHYCAEHNPHVRDRIRLMATICDAVHHAHQRATLHRDLKPANILVQLIDQRPMPKVIDFGIAKLLDRNEPETIELQRVGTPRYMSPEQLDAAQPPDLRADVFALGIVLYEILVGALPGDTATSRRTTASPITTRPSTTSASLDRKAAISPSELRGDLDRIVLKATAADPSQRYASASGFAEDLRRYLRGEPVTATPPTLRYRAGKFVRRHAIAVSIACAGFVAVIALLGVALNERAAAIEAAREARRQTARAEFVARFLLDDMLAAADPNAGDGAPVTVASVLDAADATARERFADDPELLFQILARIGRGQHLMERSERAIAALTEAIETGERLHLGVESMLPAKMDLAEALWTAPTRTKDALALRRRNRETAMTQLAPGHPLQIRARLAAIADFPTAEAALEELDAIDQARGASGPLDPLLEATALASRARLTRVAKSPEASVDAWKRAFEFSSSHFMPAHSNTIYAQTQYGLTLLELGRAADALEVLNTNREERDQVLAPDHSWRTPINYATLRCLNQLHRFEEALPIAQLQADAMRERHGEESLQYAVALGHLGAVLQGLGRLDEAVDTLELAIDGHIASFGASHLSVVGIEMRLAQVHNERNDPQSALRVSSRFIDNVKKYPTVAAQATLVHSQSLVALGRTADAIAVTDDTLSDESIVGKSRPIDVEKLREFRGSLTAP